jgi:hypothetical protein
MVRRCPTAYDPAAVCPVFDDFITDITRAQDGLSTPQAADKRAFLLRWLGYCLTGECSEQKFITLTGNGSNGKGVLTNIMVDILGDAVNGGYSDWIDFSTLAHGNRTAGQASPTSPNFQACAMLSPPSPREAPATMKAASSA